MEPAALARLQKALRGVGPLRLTFDTVGSFPQGVVLLAPSPTAGVLDLLERVGGLPGAPRVRG